MRKANSGFRHHDNTPIQYRQRKRGAQQHVFRRKIKTAQRRKKLTQEDVAAFFGDDFSRQSVSKWERGDAYPEVDKLLVLSVKLDISLEELFSDELAYLRKKKTIGSVEDSYPGLVAGLKTLADILGRNR